MILVTAPSYDLAREACIRKGLPRPNIPGSEVFYASDISQARGTLPKRWIQVPSAFPDRKLNELEAEIAYRIERAHGTHEVVEL